MLLPDKLLKQLTANSRRSSRMNEFQDGSLNKFMEKRHFSSKNGHGSFQRNGRRNSQNIFPKQSMNTKELAKLTSAAFLKEIFYEIVERIFEGIAGEVFRRN